MTSHRSQSRVPSGVPTGGQFAVSARGESGVNLEPPVFSSKVGVAHDAFEDHRQAKDAVARAEAEVRRAESRPTWKPGTKRARAKAQEDLAAAQARLRQAEAHYKDVAKQQGFDTSDDR